MYIFRGMTSPWVVYIFGSFSHSQGLVSACLALLKEDIRKAVWNFCRRLVGLPAISPDDPSSAFKRTSSTDSLNVGRSTLKISGLSSASGHERRFSRGRSRRERARIRVVDEFGLPLQGSNFQFLDETSIEQVASSTRDVENHETAEEEFEGQQRGIEDDSLETTRVLPRGDIDRDDDDKKGVEDASEKPILERIAARLTRQPMT